MLKTLSLSGFPISFSPQLSVPTSLQLSDPQQVSGVRRAVEFVQHADRKFPSLYSRLELGLSWDQVLTSGPMLDVF